MGADRTRALPVNDPDDRELVILDRPCFPRAILQLGHPAHRAKPTSRRRPADVVDAAQA